MKPLEGLLLLFLFMAVAMVFFCPLKDAEARQLGGRGFEDQRGGEAVEGPRGGESVKSPRGNVAVGTRYSVLPDSVISLIVGDRNYYLDDRGVYYLPCDDDNSFYCVVPAPQ